MNQNAINGTPYNGLTVNDLHYSPRGTKLSRILGRFASRTATYPELSEADSINAILQSTDGQRFQGFNANPIRGRLLAAVAGAAGSTVFIETGSGKGATMLAAHSFLKLPVWSCEQNLVNYLICRSLAVGIDEIEIWRLHSIDFLKQVLKDLPNKPCEVPLFFLDAHGGSDGTGKTGESCPLLTEINLICSLDRFVAVVDDVTLPGFQGGTYGTVTLDIPFLRPVLLANGITFCWVPGYSSASDLGWPSGYCIFSRGLPLDAQLSAEEFPFNLLKKQELVSDGR